MSALVATTTELFPDLGASYFYPRTKSIKFYDDQICLRWLAVSIVWLPITYYLFKLSNMDTLIAILCIMLAFYLNRDSKSKKLNENTTWLYVIGFLIIINILNKNTKNNKQKILNILGVFLIFLGGMLMNKERKGNLEIDIVGRIIFSIGFILFINSLISQF